MRLSTPSRTARSRLAAAGAVSVAALAACAPPSGGPRLPERLSPACALVPPGGDEVVARAPLDHLDVALPGSVDPEHAPVGRDGTERLVFRQLYETLVALDCTGRARPGLAATWEADSAGLRWRFRLRPGAHFWDGTPVTAEVVARSFAETPVRRDPGGPRVASARAEGPLALTLRLVAPTYGPGAFARPSLSVAGPRRPDGWPAGSGPWMPAPSGEPGGLTLEGAAPTVSARTLTFRPPPRGDDREALDGGVHVLVSADRDVLAYARALPGVFVLPLPWSRSYVMVARPPTSLAEADTVPRDVLDGLARSAVRVDARPAEPPFWWRQDAPCIRGSGAGPASVPGGFGAGGDGGGRKRVAYPEGDGVGRDLAERLVALAGRRGAVPSWLRAAAPDLTLGGGVAVAVAADPTAFAAGARDAGAAAWVLALPRAPGGDCAATALVGADPSVPALVGAGPALRVTPLLDVRASVVVRSGVAGVFLDGFGTLVFAPEGGGRP